MKLGWRQFYRPAGIIKMTLYPHIGSIGCVASAPSSNSQTQTKANAGTNPGCSELLGCCDALLKDRVDAGPSLPGLGKAALPEAAFLLFGGASTR
jgi:hypothetical protein